MLERLLGRYAELKSGDKKGFTLIELVVVIVIIAILALIAVPNIMGYVKKSEAAKVDANLRTVYTAAQLIKQTEPDLTGDEFNAAVAEQANINAEAMKEYTIAADGSTVTFNGKTNGINKIFDGSEIKDTTPVTP